MFTDTVLQTYVHAEQASSPWQVLLTRALLSEDPLRELLAAFGPSHQAAIVVAVAVVMITVDMSVAVVAVVPVPVAVAVVVVGITACRDLCVFNVCSMCIKTKSAPRLHEVLVC